MHDDVDPDAARLLAAHTYKRDGRDFRRGIKPHEERLDQYLAKDTTITLAQLADHGLARLPGSPLLNPDEHRQAMIWLRDLIAEQA